MSTAPRTRKPRANAKPSLSDQAELATRRSTPLVFISHDSRDAALAELFENLLSDVSGGTLKSFSSSDKKANSGLDFGSEWYSAIMSRLDEATDVVALLTQHSLDRPWILYEAGVAKGKLDTTVLGIALGVPLGQISTGPFGQFQNCDGDEDSLTKLVVQLLRRNPDASPREEAVRLQVSRFLEKVAEHLKSSPAKTPVETDPSASAKLFEEVKAMMRELPERIDRRIEMGRPLRRSRATSDLIHDISLRSGRMFGEGGALLSFLIMLSLVRDDAPWLYESGVDVQRAMRDDDDLGTSRYVHETLRLHAT